MSQAPTSSAPYQYQPPPPPAGWTGQQTGYEHQPKMGDAPPPYPGAAPGPYYGAAPPPGSIGGQQPVHAVYMTPSTHQQTTTTTIYATQPTHTATTVIVTGNCPKCHVGHLREENNAAMCILVAILAFLFFPIGLLYFLCLPAAVVHTCDNCRYTC